MKGVIIITFLLHKGESTNYDKLVNFLKLSAIIMQKTVGRLSSSYQKEHKLIFHFGLLLPRKKNGFVVYFNFKYIPSKCENTWFFYVQEIHLQIQEP